MPPDGRRERRGYAEVRFFEIGKTFGLQHYGPLEVAHEIGAVRRDAEGDRVARAARDDARIRVLKRSDRQGRQGHVHVGAGIGQLDPARNAFGRHEGRAPVELEIGAQCGDIAAKAGNRARRAQLTELSGQPGEGPPALVQHDIEGRVHGTLFARSGQLHIRIGDAADECAGRQDHRVRQRQPARCHVGHRRARVIGNPVKRSRHHGLTGDVRRVERGKRVAVHHIVDIRANLARSIARRAARIQSGIARGEARHDDVAALEPKVGGIVQPALDQGHDGVGEAGDVLGASIQRRHGAVGGHPHVSAPGHDCRRTLTKNGRVHPVVAAEVGLEVAAIGDVARTLHEQARQTDIGAAQAYGLRVQVQPPCRVQHGTVRQCGGGLRGTARQARVEPQYAVFKRKRGRTRQLVHGKGLVADIAPIHRALEAPAARLRIQPGAAICDDAAEADAVELKRRERIRRFHGHIGEHQHRALAHACRAQRGQRALQDERSGFALVQRHGGLDPGFPAEHGRDAGQHRQGTGLKGAVQGHAGLSARDLGRDELAAIDARGHRGGVVGGEDVGLHALRRAELQEARDQPTGCADDIGLAGKDKQRRPRQIGVHAVALVRGGLNLRITALGAVAQGTIGDQIDGPARHGFAQRHVGKRDAVNVERVYARRAAVLAGNENGPAGHVQIAHAQSIHVHRARQSRARVPVHADVARDQPCAVAVRQADLVDVERAENGAIKPVNGHALPGELHALDLAFHETAPARAVDPQPDAKTQQQQYRQQDKQADEEPPWPRIAHGVGH